MLDTAVKKEDCKVFKAKSRIGTRTFEDIPIEVRRGDLFKSVAGKHFRKILPPEIWACMVKAIMEKGLESEETQRWLDYATGFDTSGNPRSPIARMTVENFKNPEAFKVLYGEEDAKTPMDVGYVMTTGAHAIDLRLQSLAANLPGIIMKEREYFGLKDNEKYVIFNIGSGHCLDTINVLDENPELRSLVEVVCIDPDKKALSYGEALARELGIQECFRFIPKKIEETRGLGKAHLILFVGMFCPVPTETCTFILKNFVKGYLVDNGIVIFSTVQEKMLEEGILLDFIMASYGWNMYFKKDDEPGQIAKEAGLDHEETMDWEDALGYNRMTVARMPKQTVIERTITTLTGLIFPIMSFFAH